MARTSPSWSKNRSGRTDCVSPPPSDAGPGNAGIGPPPVPSFHLPGEVPQRICDDLIDDRLNCSSGPAAVSSMKTRGMAFASAVDERTTAAMPAGWPCLASSDRRADRSRAWSGKACQARRIDRCARHTSRRPRTDRRSREPARPRAPRRARRSRGRTPRPGSSRSRRSGRNSLM